MAPTDLTFSDAPFPAGGRGTPAGPNPFTDVVNSLTIDSNDGKSFTLPGSVKEEENDDLKTAIRQLRAAGAARDVSVATKTQAGGTAKSPTVTVFFKVKTRIVRPRKAEAVTAGQEGIDDGSEHPEAAAS